MDANCTSRKIPPRPNRRLAPVGLAVFLAVACLADHDVALSGIGGGGTSRSHRYLLQGTAGQPACGCASASQTTCASGFWPGYNVFPLPLRWRWNMVSVPLRTDVGLSLSRLFGNVLIRPIFQWTGSGYDQTNELLPTAGYWVYAEMDDDVPIYGLGPLRQTIELQVGWNLIGPTVACLPPAGPAVVGRIWYWNAAIQGYRYLGSGEHMLPGQAYWVYAREARLVDL